MKQSVPLVLMAATNDLIVSDTSVQCSRTLVTNVGRK